MLELECKHLKGVLFLLSYIVSKRIIMASTAEENLVYVIPAEKTEAIIFILSVRKERIDFVFDQIEI